MTMIIINDMIDIYVYTKHVNNFSIVTKYMFDQITVEMNDLIFKLFNS